jgi:hypothetical protein
VSRPRMPAQASALEVSIGVGLPGEHSKEDPTRYRGVR